nr:MAG TPA: hypothetical protein [Caudoviricetes sp.]
MNLNLISFYLGVYSKIKYFCYSLVKLANKFIIT